MVAHRCDPARANELQRLRLRLPGALDWDQTAASPELQLVSLGPDELLEPESARLVALTRSALDDRVPLFARDRLLGSLAFWRTSSSRPYGDTDLHMAEDLAHRAAFAIENARLYREAQDAVGARDEFLSIASHERCVPP